MSDGMDPATAARQRAHHLADLVLQNRTRQAETFLAALGGDEDRALAGAAVVSLGEALRALVGPARAREMLAAVRSR